MGSREKEGTTGPIDNIEAVGSDGTLESSPVVGDDDVAYPDGGVDAWMQVFAAFLTQAMAWGYPPAFGVFQLYYTETLNLPNAQVAWIGSIQTALTLLVCALAGRLADAGYAKSTVIFGAFMSIFGIFMTSLATQYWQIFLAQGVCTGIGLGLAFMPTTAIVSSYFERRRAMALAIATCGSAFGSIVFPAIMQYTLPLIGFPWAIRCSAFLALLFAIILAIIIKPRPLPVRPAPWVDLGAFKELPYLFITLTCFFAFWSMYFVTTYINAFAVKYLGYDSTGAAGLLLIINGLSLPIRPVVGWLADSYCGPINMYIISLLIFAVTELAWIGVGSRPGIYAFCACFGTIFGALQAIFTGAIGSLTKDSSKAGTRFGMLLTLMAFATLAGPPTAGAIIDADGDRYLHGQIWAGCVIIAAALLCVAAKVSKAGTGMWVKV